MRLKFDQYHEGFGTELACPTCGGSHMHHDSVEVFDCGEDATHGLHVLVKDETVKVDGDLKGNPSSRRHGLRIAVDCECGQSYDLIIKQHKGQTYLDLVGVPARGIYGKAAT